MAAGPWLALALIRTVTRLHGGGGGPCPAVVANLARVPTWLLLTALSELACLATHGVPPLPPYALIFLLARV